MAVRRRLTKRWEQSRGARPFASLTSTDRGVRLTATDRITSRFNGPRLAMFASAAERER
jgi:hypothetical protein